MDKSRSGTMDVSVNIPVASSMESMSNDDMLAIAVPRNSPSFKIMPLRDDTMACSSPDHSILGTKRVAVLLVKKVMAEFLGTFMLIFILLSAVVTNAVHGGVLGLLGVAATAGLAIVVIVSALFHVSGAHLNPAVSIAMAVFGYLPRAHLAPYMAAQLLGSVTASLAAKGIYHSTNLGAIATTVPTLGNMEAFFIEFITTFILLFVIIAVATDPKAVKELVAVAAGAAVMMNALVSAESTGGSMNPARTLGPAIATGTYTKVWIYMLAPPLGAISGTGAYIALKH
ncbi:hypothetical protein BRADI_3g17101v3 [Brachypodium distachyon]|uniref:Uncharacterized protein n=2 Tax=Brachypodium distachyon TaxID=15368 RepID=A0A0Q3FB25_BRADI|nr:hypothetical protein BRADI_3g17101v3 [Brachypodium distachyon]